jgi:predicted Zn-ribbon and HTH transcriptional regulator
VIETPTKVERLEERVNTLERSVRQIKDQLAMLPPAIDPLSWKNFDDIDKQIITLLLKEENSLTSVQIAEKLQINRVKIWRHLKRIHKISKRLKGEPIIIYDPSLKAWSMNTEEYDFKKSVESSL